jgi:hypothetical protein
LTNPLINPLINQSIKKNRGVGHDVSSNIVTTPLVH